MKLAPKTIKAIEECLEKKVPLEIKIEKGSVVIVELNRKVKSKESFITE